MGNTRQIIDKINRIYFTKLLPTTASFYFCLRLMLNITG